MHAVRKLSVWYLHFKILSTRKINTLFQKYKLVFTTGIHTCIDHTFVNIWEFEMPRQLTDTKTSHEKWIHIFSVSIVIIPTRLLCQMQASSSGAEFLSTISKFIARKKILSLLVYVVHETWKCGSRAVTTKKCTKKRDERAKLLFWIIIIIIIIIKIITITFIYTAQLQLYSFQMHFTIKNYTNEYLSSL